MKYTFFTRLTPLFLALSIGLCHAADLKIDPAATSAAPWEVGEKIATVGCSFLTHACYRTFQGITPEGYRVVQDFYEDGQKATDPFLINTTVELEKLGVIGQSPALRDTVIGTYTIWYPSGEKYGEILMNEDRSYTITAWFTNGTMSGKIQLSPNDTTLVYQEWDNEGNLIVNKTTP